jgi:hypothetical protein
MTMILVILRLAMLRKLTPEYFEDSDKYNIPVKVANLHNSEFVNRMQPINLHIPPNLNVRTLVPEKPNTVSWKMSLELK